MIAMEEQSIEIAQIIHQQLTDGQNKIKVWSWGANNWTAITNGLLFQVQGFKFTGHVAIVLGGNDLYKILLMKDMEVVKDFSDVYFDEMVDLIDNQVEFTGENYANDIDTAVYKF